MYVNMFGSFQRISLVILKRGPVYYVIFEMVFNIVRNIWIFLSKSRIMLLTFSLEE